MILFKEVSFMKNRRKILAVVLCIGLLTPYSVSSAHGHHNNSNSGKYHYNCGGHRYPAHLHKNGVCPYSSSKQCPTCYRTSTIKKVQKKLNKLGYRCGKTGKYDTKTKSAICKYQKKKCIAVNGKINETLLKKMNIAHK